MPLQNVYLISYVIFCLNILPLISIFAKSIFFYGSFIVGWTFIKSRLQNKCIICTVNSGSINMGSMGFWEPVNFWVVGSGTHQFYQEEIRIFLLSIKTEDWTLEIGFRNPSIKISNGATDQGYFFFAKHQNFINESWHVCSFSVDISKLWN